MPTDEDVAKLKKALENERAQHKEAQATIKKLTTDHEAATKRVGELEALDKLAPLADGSMTTAQVAEQIDSIVAVKLAKATAEHKMKIGELETKLGESGATIEKLNGTLTKRTINDVVKQAASEAHVLPNAIDTVLKLAELELKVGDDGTPRTADGADVATWLDGQKQTRGYFWPISKGANARGARGEYTQPIVNNPWAPEARNLTEQGRILTQSPQLAERLQAEAKAMTR
jgi:DNA repair exonuclease SbcCD ATPase subunit